jgi:hypothetical protein
VGRDGGSSKVDLGKARSGIFFLMGLDRGEATDGPDLPVGQIRGAGQLKKSSALKGG